MAVMHVEECQIQVFRGWVIDVRQRAIGRRRFRVVVKLTKSLMATQVEPSSYPRFNGLRLGYRLDLRQKGNRVTGTGRKVSENGRKLATAGQTPIVVEGTIAGDRVRLQFTEAGRRRPSRGRFDLYVTEEGQIRGRFTSDAARSAGSVQARREDG